MNTPLEIELSARSLPKALIKLGLQAKVRICPENGRLGLRILSFRGHMGLLALRPGDSLTILVDGFVNGLQESQFPSFLPFKLRGLDFYPGGTRTH